MNAGAHNMPADAPDSNSNGAGQFLTTHWSRVLAAGDTRHPDSTQALGELCQSYWYPLYAYLRRLGRTAHDAQDLTQAFLLSLLERQSLKQVTPEKGKFRSFLLAALKHFLADEWDKQRAQKRGGGQVLLSLDGRPAEARFQDEPRDDLTPDKWYDRQWALTLLEQAFARLRAEHADRAQQFQILYPFLNEVPAEGAYEEAGQRLNLPPGSVRVAVHRLRLRYRELVREEVAKTVASGAEVETELREIIRTICG